MLAPGAGPPSVTAGRLIAAPASTSFQASVSGSNHAPRNHAWFTFAPGSVTVAAKDPSSQGLSAGAPPHNMNPPDVSLTAAGLLPDAIKFRVLNENTASTVE